MSARPHPSAWSYLLCYAFWLVTLALGLVNAAIIREWAQDAYVRSGLDHWGFVAADQFVLVLAALVLLGATVWLEYFYRVGVARGLLWRRFKWSAGVLLVVPAVRLVALLVELVLGA
jgi:ABC-type multidrug transport system permease subunit